MAFFASGLSNRRPISRFTAKTVFSGFVTAWRLAICPTRRSPDSVKPTIDGVVRAPSLFGMTTGSPPSITATHELVVPRSIPMTLPIAAFLPRLRFGGCRLLFGRLFFGRLLGLRLRDDHEPWPHQ